MANLFLKVVDRIAETPDACTFFLQATSGDTLYYKPGQFLTILLTFENKELRRSYSLCTVPIKDKYLGITIKRIRNGLVSNYLIDNLKIGDEVESLYPSGMFFPVLEMKNKREYFLFAAGSGITPLFSVLQSILLKEPDSNINLIYCNREESSIIYKRRLDELEIQFIDKLKVVHVLSKPSENWMGFRGRINSSLVCDLISELSQKVQSDSRFFLCGPTEFMQTCEKAIIEMGYPYDLVKKENFVASLDLLPTMNQMEGEKEVKLLFGGGEYSFFVPKGDSILKAAIENGIKLPYSCTSGVCTACLGTCTEGEVDISGSDALSENEKKKGYILTCIGKPLSKKVVITID